MAGAGAGATKILIRSRSRPKVGWLRNPDENLYKKDPAEPQNFDNIIEDFLGPEILNSNVVSASKLSEQEVNSMELPISLAELDLSLKEGNAKSAPGMDGMGNGHARYKKNLELYPTSLTKIC